MEAKGGVGSVKLLCNFFRRNNQFSSKFRSSKEHAWWFKSWSVRSTYCLFYTSYAADERRGVDRGGRRNL